MLTNKQAKDIYNAMKTGSGVPITPTKEQRGGFLGALLAGIAAPLVIDTLKGLTGSGAPQMGLPKIRSPRSIPPRPFPPRPIPPKNRGQDGGLVIPRDWIPPPFYGNWPDQTIGAGKKKKNVQKREKGCC